MSEKHNAKQLPTTYYVRHMIPGVCGYSSENVLVDLDAIKKMAPTFAGKPIYVGHQTVDVEELENESVGTVFDCFYNECDGWFWSRVTIHGDAGHEALRKGWAPSNAYIPNEWGNGGQFNAVDFNRKILNGVFTHLAIVQNPRYEEAKFFTPDEYRKYQEEKRNELNQLLNSKDEKKGISMFKIFKKAESKTEITNEADVTDDSIVEFEGKEYSVKDFRELLNAKSKKNEDESKKEDEEKANEEDESKKKDESEKENEDDSKYTVDGEEVSLKDLKNSYMANKKSKKNEAEEDEEKKNSKFFEELRNANNKAPQAPAAIDMQMDKIARGKARY